MSTSFSRAPHIEGSSNPVVAAQAPNAALLIDFDNVTMGMRSDLSKELKTLLKSDIIRGKVTVQRAYADWRRYPQYIVPLSEASIDLIFAPAYGSSKKNATDIRMAIDGMELVFTRPEIGTYILLTGDSDFSSLVLKLKEYGKYVIGVGIQESSSDILVQNCDEYYSYTSLSGLRKTTDSAKGPALDPWVLAEQAVEQMQKRSDVMRSDRLKQVMLEIDPGFDEKSYGFSKFSRFLTEAAQKGLFQLKKMQNGQYEILASGREAQSRGSQDRSDRKEARNGRSRRDDGRRSEGRSDARSQPASRDRAQESEPAATRSGGRQDRPSRGGREALEPAYDLLKRAIGDLLKDQDSDAVRDSDVKRRMLALDSSFDEAELGFGKFSLFLRQAHDHEVVDLRKGENGQYHVALPAGRAAERAPEPSRGTEPEPDAAEPEAPSSEAAAPTTEKAPGGRGRDEGRDSRRLRPRLSGRRRGSGDAPPELLEGQAVKPPRRDEPSLFDAADTAEGRSGTGSPQAGAPQAGAPQAGAPQAGAPQAGTPPTGPAGPGEVLDPAALRLPTGRSSVIKYLSNSYRGVGEKTAEMLVDALGEDLFRVLQSDPDQVNRILPAGRAEKVLEAWEEDFARRRSRLQTAAGGPRNSSS